LILQPLQHEIDGFKEERNGGKHFALGRVSEHSFLDAILGEISVEIDLCFVDKFEVGSNDNACPPATLLVHVKYGGGDCAGQSSPFNCCVLKSKPRNWSAMVEVRLT
tara:strand:- start:4844 stop:5164 length:321 start_codon:yes stop_codon:yes gene_type:complete